MNRLLLIVLGGPLIFLALVQIAIWIGEPGAGRLASTATPTTGFPALTRRALQRYHGLSPVEQRGLRDRLHAAMWTPARWRDEIQPQFSLLCLGEQHSGPLRARLHEAVLGGLAFDLLALETDAAGLTAIRLALDKSTPIELLEAPIDRLLRPLLRRPRPPRLVAIDESAAQREQRRQGLTTREASLVGNLLLMIAVSVWAVGEGGMDQAVSTGMMVTIVSLGYGALAANVVSVAVLVSDTLMSRQ